MRRTKYIKKIRSLDGSYPAHPIAYCKHHDCTLTVGELRRKRCIGKRCYHLVKFIEHGYWQTNADRNKKKKERKRYVEKSTGNSPDDSPRMRI